MAERGDPSNPDDHDDLIGFASPAALAGQFRVVPERAPEPIAAPAQAADPTPAERRVETPEPDATAPAAPRSLDSPSVAVTDEAAAVTDTAVVSTPVSLATPRETRPVEAGSIFEPSRDVPARSSRRKEPQSLPGGGMGLFAVYALILFSVPTFGVSTVLGLMAVTGRPGPQDPVSRSHFIYQQRTLWAAAVVTLAGFILLVAATFALGVPTLFLLACWLALRGAAGVWALKAGRPIARPRGWWI